MDAGFRLCAIRAGARMGAMAPSDSPPSMRRAAAVAAGIATLAWLAGCAVPGPMTAPAGMGPTEAREALLRVLPPRLADRAGWAADIHAALATLEQASTPHTLCAMVAVTEQESGFQVDPPVPGLAAIAWKEIERRAEEAGVPKVAVRAALALGSPTGRSYAERIDAVKTERQLSEIFEDFIGIVPMGRSFLASRNPVRTGGPMQVSIAFAEAHAKARPYPYPIAESVRREVFTRRGGLYFGAAHLFGYDAPYDRLVYRYADFNAGRWASRNAGFQNALAVAAGVPVALDGDLLLPGGPGRGETERVAGTLAGRLGLDDAAVRRDLEKGEGPGFEKTLLYERVFAYAEQLDRRALPRAVVPRIDLHSPKFTRRLTTAWFAQRVDERHQRCLARMGGGED